MEASAGGGLGRTDGSPLGGVCREMSSGATRIRCNLNHCLFSNCCWSRENQAGREKKTNPDRAHSVIYVVKEISGDLKRREYIIETNV